MVSIILVSGTDIEGIILPMATTAKEVISDKTMIPIVGGNFMILKFR
jgi:hypothetical protein